MKQFFDFSGFTQQQYLFLICGFLFFVMSLFFYYKQKDKLAIILLTISGLSFFVFAALLDPFLNFWDERFHALVAKNSMDNFWVPTLYKELPYQENDPLIWSYAHVWLHKQPLFIWQIALSFKLFGVSEFTLRLPSVLMATGLILICYRIGTLLVDKKLGYYTAIAVTFSWFLLDLVSGHAEVEHNNVCFLFYVSASVWTWMEYIHSNRKLCWLIATAVLCAGAVLTKWLTGLLVFFIWGIYLLSTYRFKLKEWKIGHLLLAIAIVAALVLPWQIYTFVTFPEVAKVEYEYNSVHLFNAVESHTGNVFFHIKALPYLYIGDSQYEIINDKSLNINLLRGISLLILLSGLAMLIYRLKRNNVRITLISTLAFIYVFFSIAATKMTAYPFCIAAIWFMSLGMIFYLIENLLFRIKNRYAKFLVWLVVISIFAFYQMNFTWIRNYHTEQCWYRKAVIHNKNVFQKIRTQIPPKTIIFNVRAQEDWGVYKTNIECMFYTDALCYAGVPDNEQLQYLKKQGYTIAVLTSHEVPVYMLEDTTVIKLNEILYADL